MAVPIDGGVPSTVCRYTDDACRISWSSDGKVFYLAGTQRTFAIPLPAGKALPGFSSGGINDPKLAAVAGGRTIEAGLISPGSDPSIYVFTKTDSQRNLFRIPLH
jgi:hypothetical protein